MLKLSRKIIQLTAYESKLKELKKVIVLQNIATLNEPENEILREKLNKKMKEYEVISAKYNDLFKDILLDSTKMKKEYQDVRR